MHRCWQIDLDVYAQVEEMGAMANKEHLARLQQGVEAWNGWRDENRTIRPEDPEVEDPEVEDPEVEDPEVGDSEVGDSEVGDPEVNRPGANPSWPYLCSPYIPLEKCVGVLLPEQVRPMTLVTRAYVTRVYHPRIDLSRANLR